MKSSLSCAWYLNMNLNLAILKAFKSFLKTFYSKGLSRCWTARTFLVATNARRAWVKRCRPWRRRWCPSFRSRRRTRATRPRPSSRSRRSSRRRSSMETGTTPPMACCVTQTGLKVSQQRPFATANAKKSAQLDRERNIDFSSSQNISFAEALSR